MESNLSPLLVLVPVFAVLAYRRWKAMALPAGLILPPGPAPLPVFGSALCVSRNAPWLTYTAWAEQYGPLVYIRLLGRDVVIINSEQLVEELVERRSSIYNDRPRCVMNEFFGMNLSSGLLPYGETWRLHRRLLHQTFRAAAIPRNMHQVMLRKRRQLVKAVVGSPDECLDLLRAYATSVIMAVVYGYETQSRNDRLVNVVDRMLAFVTHALTPEREVLASTFPIIKYIPTWMPGSQFRRDALQCRAYRKEMLEAPFELTLNAMASGNAPSSMVADLLSRYTERDDNNTVREAIKASACTVFGAGSGTTDTVMLCFILAMVLHPEVQRRAQAEIDKVVKTDRLPDFGDRSSLPYIDAVLRELLRWRPPSPLGVPHATCQSDTYHGYYIPKGAMVIINVWAMSRAEKYPDPEAFCPERFLSESGTLTEYEALFTFGAGRRTCVGKHFADAIVWLTMVTLLSCFEFSKVEEGWGMGNVEWTSGVTVAPRPFPFKLTTRARAMAVSDEE